MKSTKIKSWLLALVMLMGTVFLSVSMAGCNVNKGSADTLRIIAHSQMEDYLEPFFEQFMADNPDIKIEGLYGVDQLAELDTSLPPDLLFTGNVDMLNIPHVFEDLNVLLDSYYGGDIAKINEFKSQFLPNILDYSTLDDRLLFLPNNINVGLLYYNKDIFDAAKIAYPTNKWTHADYIAAGKALTKKDGNTYTQWGASTTSGWWGEYLIYVRQFGGDFYLSDGVTPAMNTPEFKKGIQFFKDKAVGENKFAPNPGSTAVGEGALGGFLGRATAMEFGGHTGNWPSFNALSNFNWDVEILPTPVENSQATGGEIAVEGWGIAKKSMNKEKALRFLMYLYSQNGMKTFSSAGKLMPTVDFKKMILDTPKAERSFPQNMEAVFEEMERGLPLPSNVNFAGSAQAPVYNEIAKFLNGAHVSINAFATASVSAVNAYVKSQS